MSVAKGFFDWLNEECFDVDWLESHCYWVLSGAICGWCWDNTLWEWGYILKYWPAVIFIVLLPQVMVLRRLMYWSGFMSEVRGIHGAWSFRSGRWY